MNYFSKIHNVLKRELRQMFRRPLYLFASVGVMTLSTFFFLTLMSKGAAQQMPVAVVDHDQTSISRRLTHELAATQAADVVLITSSFSEAREAMQQGKVYGIIVIPEDFYAELVAMHRPQLDFYVTNAYTVGGNTAYKQLLTMVNLTSGAFQREVLRKKGMPDYVIMNRIQPVSIDAHMIGNPWSNYSIYLTSVILPGILGLIVLMLTIFAIGYELKTQTSREWLETAGGNYTAAMIGKLFPYTVLFAVLGIGCSLILFRFAGFPVKGSLPRLMGAMVLFVMAMESMGIFLIGCLPTLRDAISIGALYGMLGFSLSGFTYPVMNMLPPVQALSYLVPLRHYYLIYVNEALMGAPVQNSLLPAACLCAFMLLAMTTSLRLRNALIHQNYPLK